MLTGDHFRYCKTVADELPWKANLPGTKLIIKELQKPKTHRRQPAAESTIWWLSEHQGITRWVDS